MHSHLALAFDRTIDALLQAAADNNYVSSYYWLPWKNRVGLLRAAGSSGDAEPGHDPERERKPGLIVLKYVPPQEEDDSGKSYYQAIFVFLVAETPTQGVDGFQLQNAFSYEDALEKGLGSSRFSEGGSGTAIIGPLYSGSAASLRMAVETEAKRRAQTTRFEITGATGTALALKRLSTGASRVNPRIQYLSFDQNGEYDEKTFLDRLSISGYDLHRVALLTEDNTALGNTVSSGNKADRFDQILKIRFPREISLLRNAQVVGDPGGSDTVPPGSVPSPYLHLSLKDSSAEDSIPQFSRENTPLSQEAQLMTIARQLHRYRSEFIAIVASNPLDQIFLAQFLHRACPDARLVFFGGDLLMEREIDNVPFVGTVTVTPYSLIGVGQTSRSILRAYPDSQSEGYYNAASYAFGKITAAKRLRLKGYSTIFDPENSDEQHPYLWATAVGIDGYYPLGILSMCASNWSEILPTIDRDNKTRTCKVPIKAKQTGKVPQNGKGQRSATDQTTLQQLRIYPSLLWIVICTLVSLLCLLHFLILCVADYWSPFTRDLAVNDNDQPRRRSMYVHVGTAMLFSMALVVAWPVIALAFLVELNRPSIALSCWTLACGLLAFLAVLCKTVAQHWVGEAPIRPPAGPDPPSACLAPHRGKCLSIH